jgi:hypothetical protein
MTTQPVVSSCPKCGRADRVVGKLLVLAKERPANLEEGGHWPYQLAADECSPAALLPAPLGQFVDGCYCQLCGVGFVPSALLL